jgi:hypothetical protein
LPHTPSAARGETKEFAAQQLAEQVVGVITGFQGIPLTVPEEDAIGTVKAAIFKAWTSVVITGLG